MVTEGSVKMAPTPAANLGYEEFERDFEALLREQQHQSRAAHDREGGLNLYRSGSAPPTVEGSRTAVGSLFRLPGLPESVRLDGHDAGEALSEEEMRSHPAYLSFYYSNENLNPRLPPPMVSKEDWKVAQRFHGFGGIGDRRRKTESWDGDGSGSSLFSLQPGGLGRRGERELIEPAVPQKQSAEWLERGSDGLIGLSDVGLGMRRKSFADVIQEGLVHSTSVSGHLSRPASRNAFDNLSYQTVISDPSLLHNGSQSAGGLHSGAYTPNLVRVKSLGSSHSQSFASAVRSPGKTTTTGCEPIRRLPSPCLPSMERELNKTDKKILAGSNGHVASNPAMLSAFSSLRLSEKFMPEGGNVARGKLHEEYGEQPESLLHMPLGHKHYMQQKLINNSEDELLNSSTNSFPVYADFSEENGLLSDADLSKMPSNGQFNLQKQLVSGNLHKSVVNAGSFNSPGSSHYQAAEVQHNQGLSVMSNNQYDAGLALGGVIEGQYLSNVADNVSSNFPLPVSDPIYAQHAQGPSDYGTQAAARLDPSFGNNLLGNSYMEMPELQRAYLETLLAEQRLQYDMQFSNKSDELNHGLYSASTFGLGMPYQASPLSSSVVSSLGPVGPLRQSARLSHFPSLIRSATGGYMGSWNMGNNLTEGFASSLLDEFKNNKSRAFELSDIMDHVVEFSMDQFGSRFIQQKLETASVEEKNMIFPKLLPQARSLMTDVFGNYVIQKFFEHGTEIQRKELANQLTGHVLPLSLQMYGCRVIQKALEVVDIDQQTQMVLELEGSIMKCVRDQNGNHVVQKCIECVPQERIQFIVKTFYGQVVALSTHPYGCRVIQRVLEHCDDPETQSTMMEEILKSVCTLAQDQYGNYVIQHVLQHGKPEERSAIISKLTGQIVRMSQQKFASNVIEKCLTYGSPEERQLLINEMLGSTDENDPLQAMMKDQFANYVVQKVLETCDDRNRELILSRIKVHLNGLKKYTYGKHIVARVEKLIATGERRIGIASYSS